MTLGSSLTFVIFKMEINSSSLGIFTCCSLCSGVPSLSSTPYLCQGTPVHPSEAFSMWSPSQSLLGEHCYLHSWRDCVRPLYCWGITVCCWFPYYSTFYRNHLFPPLDCEFFQGRIHSCSCSLFFLNYPGVSMVPRTKLAFRKCLTSLYYPEGDFRYMRDMKVFCKFYS